MTGGGPGHATESLAMMMYTYSFGLNKMGYGTAISIILFVVILIIPGFRLRFCGEGRIMYCENEKKSSEFFHDTFP